jgi:hypothetical protein
VKTYTKIVLAAALALSFGGWALSAETPPPSPLTSPSDVSRMRAALAILNDEKAAAENRAIALQVDLDAAHVEAQAAQAKAAETQKLLDAAKAACPPAEKPAEAPK